jgi:transposase-like protein
MRNDVNANQLRRWVQLHQRRSAAAVKPLPGKRPANSP